MKIGNYEFELKGFKCLEGRSEETYCFDATLYVNGKRLASCGNYGHGGNTDVHIFPECEAFGKEVTDFLKTQPKIKSEHIEDFEMDCDLENIVDELVDKLMEARELQKIKNKTKKSLILQDGDDYYMRGWKGHTIESMLKDPKGRELVKKAIAEEIAKGRVLINENIPAELLPASK